MAQSYFSIAFTELLVDLLCTGTSPGEPLIVTFTWDIG